MLLRSLELGFDGLFPRAKGGLKRYGKGQERSGVASAYPSYQRQSVYGSSFSKT